MVTIKFKSYDCAMALDARHSFLLPGHTTFFCLEKEECFSFTKLIQCLMESWP